MNLPLLEDSFEDNFRHHGELGASLSVWKDGEEIVSLASGFQDREKERVWTTETPVLVWSATKGVASGCLHHACEQHSVPLSTPVSELWPALSHASGMTIAHVLSHQAGLPALSTEAPVTDHGRVIAALEREEPLWAPGTSHGYHPRTFGFLLDHLVRRIAGEPLGAYWRKHLAEPLSLDFWIGIPQEAAEHVAPVYPARASLPVADPFYRAFTTPGSLTQRAFASPGGLHSVSAMNSVEARTLALPAFGGIGTARALGKYYAMLSMGGAWEGKTFFSAGSLSSMQETLVQGGDPVLMMDTAFSAGFMKDPVNAHGVKMRSIFGPSSRAFGQPGAGGSHAFADPENGIALAYVMNQMEPGVLPGGRVQRLVDALYA